jgi:hypothetical protein
MRAISRMLGSDAAGAMAILDRNVDSGICVFQGFEFLLTALKFRLHIENFDCPKLF